MSEQTTIPAPGRERDALVAERVMGWTRWQRVWVHDNGQLEPPRPWSTAAAAALDVLKAIEQKGYTWSLARDHRSPAEPNALAYWCAIFGGSPVCCLVMVGADTIANAITAASLRALEAERC